MKTYISVIIPCYNVGRYLARCLDSLLGQTFGTELVEIICVDDASSDDTPRILEDYASKYPDTIRVITREENARQGKARNEALREAQGDWIAYIDSDDWVEPEYIDYLNNCVRIAGPDVQVVTCEYERDFSEEFSLFDIDRAGIISSAETRGRRICVNSEEERRLFIRNRILSYSVYSKLIRRDFLLQNEILFPENLAYEDIYWGGLLNMYASDVYLTEAKLYHYFVNRKSTLLAEGAGYHYDMLTVQERLWNEYIRRGLMDRFHSEIELEFVYSCALAFWKIIVLRFEKPPYSMYQLLCIYVQTHIPQIMDNEYVKQGVMPEMYILMLNSLFTPMSRDQFEQFAIDIRRIGI